MKKLGLTLLPLPAGVLGLGLRLWRMSYVDSQTGLLTGGTLAAVLLAVLMLAMAGCILLLTRDETGETLSLGAPGRVGQAVLCAYLIYSGVWTLLSGADVLGYVAAVLALAAAVGSLGLVANLKGSSIPLCLYCVLTLIIRFRGWIRDPQIANFVYALLAGVTLMLAVYHRAAMELGMGNSRAFRRWSLLALFLAVVSADSGNWAFCGVTAVWLLGGQLSLTDPEQ